MKNKYTYLFLAIAFAVIGFAAMKGDGSAANIIQGLAKGCAGVCFILYFIFMLLGNQPTDKSTH